MDTRFRFCYMYTAAFCIRRFIIALFTIALSTYVSYMLIVSLLLQLITLSVYLKVKPFVTKGLNYIETITESMICLSVYYMMSFTYWINDTRLRYNLGFSLMYFIIIVICFNLAIIIIMLYYDLKKKWEKYKYD